MRSLPNCLFNITSALWNDDLIDWYSLISFDTVMNISLTNMHLKCAVAEKYFMEKQSNILISKFD